MSVREVLSRFRACRGSLELFASVGRAAVELLQSNPLAGFCLAINEQFRQPPPVSPLTSASHMMWRPQREILGWLGFPATEAVAKLGRKCLPQSLARERCLRFRRALGDESVRALLAHLPRINTGVIELATLPGAPRRIAPQLFAEVAQQTDDEAAAAVAALLRDTYRLAAALQRRQELRQVRSSAQLRQLHDTLVQDYNQRHGNR
ncbi:MAG: hypothetical protein N3B01_11145, partial [Verrucomicrobiae bacterium]|nr:hypothetical protein [Verrucomicrobiae bacterium]